MEEEDGYALGSEPVLHHLLSRPVPASIAQRKRLHATESYDSGTFAQTIGEHQQRMDGSYLDGSVAKHTQPQVVAFRDDAMQRSQVRYLRAAVAALFIMVLFLAFVTRALYDDNAEMNRLMAFGKEKLDEFSESGILDTLKRSSAMANDEVFPWMQQTMAHSNRLMGDADTVSMRSIAIMDRAEALVTRLASMVDSGITIGGLPKHKNEDVGDTWVPGLGGTRLMSTSEDGGKE